MLLGVSMGAPVQKELRTATAISKSSGVRRGGGGGGGA